MQPNAALEWAKKHMIPLIVVGVVLVVVIGLLSTWNAVVNERNTRENDVSAMYSSTQNELSGCLSKSTQAANVTKAEAKVMKEALTEALQARYTTKSTADPTSGKLFSAIVEQYPDLKPFENSFKDAFVVMIGCREDFKNAQKQLIDKVKSYNTWKDGTLTVRFFANAPSNHLEADTGDGTIYKGAEALAKIKRIIRTPKTIQAYSTGVLEEEDPFEEGGN